MLRLFTLKMILLLSLNALSFPSPQGSQHGQRGTGSMSTPVPGFAGMRRGRWRDWKRGDPTLLNNLWKSKTPLGNAEVYIVLALLIGLITVIIGCWLSDNCWSPEPEQHGVMIA